MHKGLVTSEPRGTLAGGDGEGARGDSRLGWGRGVATEVGMDVQIRNSVVVSSGGGDVSDELEEVVAR